MLAQGRNNSDNEPYIHGVDLEGLHPKLDKSANINKNHPEMINIVFKSNCIYKYIILVIPEYITI